MNTAELHGLALFSAVSDAIVGVRSDGLIYLWNRGAERMFGHTVKDAVGKPLDIIVPERLVEAHHRGFAHHLKSGERRLFDRAIELPAVHANGDEFPVELVLNRFDEDGQTYFVGLFRDLTERKRAEAATLAKAKKHAELTDILLNLSHRPFRNIGEFQRELTETMSRALNVDRVSIWDMVDGGIACADLFLRREGLHQGGAVLYRVDFPAYFEAIESADRIAADDAHQHPATACFAATYLVPNGIHSMLDVPIRHLEKGILGVICVESLVPCEWSEPDVVFCKEVAALLAMARERMAHEAQLRRMNDELEQRVRKRTAELQISEARFQQLFRQAPQAMLMFDEKQCVLQSNLNARRLFGYDEAGFRGLPLSRLLPVEAREHHQGLAADYLLEPTARDMSGGRQVRALRSNGDVFFAEIGLVPLQDNGRARVLAGVTDISARLAAEHAINEALREKEVLLKEIHHRVKNNLQIISSLLTMQIDRSAAEDVRYALQESVYRIRSMGLIHELLYGVETLDSLDFGSYATALVQRLRSTFGERVTIAMETHPVSVTIDQAVPLGLIVNELLTNAFKHALQSPGGETAKVSVNVFRQADVLHIVIADNGPGFPPGFTMEKTNTLGMQLVRSLKRQLRAQARFSSGPGARIELDVPLDPT